MNIADKIPVEDYELARRILSDEIAFKLYLTPSDKDLVIAAMVRFNDEMRESRKIKQPKPITYE